MKLFLSTVGLSVMLMAGVAQAAGNIFCDRKQTADPECQKAMEEIYQEMSKGYAAKVRESQPDKTMEAAQEEFKEVLSHARFEKIFKTCGESSKVEKDAGPCLAKELEQVAKERVAKIMNSRVK